MKISEIINNYMSTRESIEEQSKKMKDLREREKKYSNAILTFMNTNQKKSFVVGNNTFENKINKSYSSISQKLLKDSLYKYFEDEKKATDLFKFILNNRELTESNELKLKINKKE